MANQQHETGSGLDLAGLGAAALLLVGFAVLAGIGLGTVLWVGW